MEKLQNQNKAKYIRGRGKRILRRGHQTRTTPEPESVTVTPTYRVRAAIVVSVCVCVSF